MASAITGATRPEQLDTAAASTDLTLSADEIRALEEPYQYRAPAD